MTKTTVIGIDCATDDAKVGIAKGVASAGIYEIVSARVCSSAKAVADEVVELLSASGRALIALDAPLGWPRSLGTALADHRAGQALPFPANELFRRETDRFVKDRVGKQSLDVGADRIARTAHAALRLLADVRQKTSLPIPLAWTSDFIEPVAAIEVYPAATLVGCGIHATGYKKRDTYAERRVLLERLERHVKLPDDRSSMEQNADALDAAVCVLAGFDFLRGQAYCPSNEDLARHEGWIWVRPKR